jgi:hypothetical protein
MPNWTPEQIALVATSLAAFIGAVAAVVSAMFAVISVRTQRRAQLPHVKVTHSTVLPVFDVQGRDLSRSKLGDPWFAITVLNDGLLPVTVRTAALVFDDGGSAPYLAPPWPGFDSLPKLLAPGDEATLWLDEMPKIAEVHAEHGARWVKANIGGDVEFHGKRIDRKWLDGWVKAAAAPA